MQTLKKINEELTCVICLEKLKQPKCLPCIHSFCCECLELIAKGNKIECPVCRKEADIPQGDVKNFPTNFLIQNILDQIDNEELMNESKKEEEIKEEIKEVKEEIKEEIKKERRSTFTKIQLRDTVLSSSSPHYFLPSISAEPSIAEPNSSISSNTEMKGYLEKTGEGFGSLVWKKRYCELSNNYLIYYQNGVFKGQIPLQNATISWIGNKVFQLKLPYRTYSFKGSSIAECEKWIESISASQRTFSSRNRSSSTIELPKKQLDSSLNLNQSSKDKNVPYSDISALFNDELYYFPLLSKSDSETLLSNFPENHFIIRNSLQMNTFIISFQRNRATVHDLIQQSSENQFILKGQTTKSFSNFSHLIQHLNVIPITIEFPKKESIDNDFISEFSKNSLINSEEPIKIEEYISLKILGWYLQFFIQRINYTKKRGQVVPSFFVSKTTSIKFKLILLQFRLKRGEVSREDYVKGLILQLEKERALENKYSQEKKVLWQKLLHKRIFLIEEELKAILD